MAHVELRERFGHDARVLDLQEVRRTRKNETFSVRQPAQQQLLSLRKALMKSEALLAKHDEDRLGDPPRFLLSEPPDQACGQIRLEECRRVRHRLRECARKHAFKRLPVPRPPQLDELVDGNLRTYLAIALEAIRERLSVHRCALADQ